MSKGKFILEATAPGELRMYLRFFLGRVFQSCGELAVRTRNDDEKGFCALLPQDGNNADEFPVVFITGSNLPKNKCRDPNGDTQWIVFYGRRKGETIDETITYIEKTLKKNGATWQKAAKEALRAVPSQDQETPPTFSYEIKSLEAFPPCAILSVVHADR